MEKEKEKEMMDRNFYLEPNDAITKGLVDGILKVF
jgi:ATP-dependent protease ClpP protease subunit